MTLEITDTIIYTIKFTSKLKYVSSSAAILGVMSVCDGATDSRVIGSVASINNIITKYFFFINFFKACNIVIKRDTKYANVAYISLHHV